MVQASTAGSSPLLRGGNLRRKLEDAIPRLPIKGSIGTNNEETRDVTAAIDWDSRCDSYGKAAQICKDYCGEPQACDTKGTPSCSQLARDFASMTGESLPCDV